MKKALEIKERIRELQEQQVRVRYQQRNFSRRLEQLHGQYRMHQLSFGAYQTELTRLLQNKTAAEIDQGYSDRLAVYEKQQRYLEEQLAQLRQHAHMQQRTVLAIILLLAFGLSMMLVIDSYQGYMVAQNTNTTLTFLQVDKEPWIAAQSITTARSSPPL